MFEDTVTIDAGGVTAVETRHEPEAPTQYRYEIAVVMINAVTNEEALVRFESNCDRIDTVLDTVRAMGYGHNWGLHEDFVTDRAECEF